MSLNALRVLGLLRDNTGQWHCESQLRATVGGDPWGAVAEVQHSGIRLASTTHLVAPDTTGALVCSATVWIGPRGIAREQAWMLP